ncbi:MAG TPA: LysE family transporter [Gemmatimonadales bacterium]|nr:LysE family transporter [Gemmatimonadales bacterium]
MSLLERGTILGFSIAAPVGPIGVLVIRESMTAGWKAGLLTGLGAATADGLYGLIGGLGLTAISALLVSHATALRVVGGLFMLWLGARTFLALPASDVKGTATRADGRIYLTGLLLTVTNPMTILAFAAMFAGIGLGSGVEGGGSGVATLVAGVLAGSTAWWLMLSGAASIAGRRLTPSRLRWVNRASGLIIAVFGTVALVAA